MNSHARTVTTAVAMVVLLAAAPAALAQPVQADWAGAGPGYWDDPAMWIWPVGSAPPEGYPHDTWGGLYDCRLITVGDQAVLRSDIAVFDLLLDQELKLIDDATLTLTSMVGDMMLPAPPWPTGGGTRYPLAVGGDGMLHGNGEVRALGANLIGTVMADGPGEDLDFIVDEIYMDGAGGARIEALNHATLTVQCLDLNVVSGGQQATIQALNGGHLSLSGHLHGSSGNPILADGNATLELDGATVEYTNNLQIQHTSHADFRDSSVIPAGVSVDSGSTLHVYDSTFYDEVAMGGPIVTVTKGVGDPSHLSINQGYCHIGTLDIQDDCTLVVNPLGHLEVDDMNLGTDAVCTVQGVIETNSPTSWTGHHAQVVMEGGEIRGGFQSNVPLSGFGTIATGPLSPGMTQQDTITARGGVLELAPGASLTMEHWELNVAPAAEFFINDAYLLGYEIMIGVANEGVLRLNDATVDGWTAIYLGSLPAATGSGPAPLGEAPPPGAELIATGDNEVAGDLYVRPDSEASILSGETCIEGLSNEGEVWIAPGAELCVEIEDGGAWMFDNYYAIDVAGTLDVYLHEEAAANNEGVIDIVGDGVFHLRSMMYGSGDIVVEDNGVFHPHDAVYALPMPTGDSTIRLEGGTLCGTLQTDHAVEGYGTITGSHAVISGGVTANAFGETLYITDAYIQLIPGELGDSDLTATDGAFLKIEDAGIETSTVMVTGDGDPDPLGSGSSEFWVRGFSGLRSGGPGMGPTVLFIRDATVMLPGHVEAGGLLLTHGDANMLGVEVHNGGSMEVHDNTNLCYLGVGTMHPETEEMGGGEVLVSPGATLSVQEVGVFDGAQGGPGLVRVEGDLHFRPSMYGPEETGATCEIVGDGRIQLAGGVISGEAQVYHNMPESIHGHGRIAAALINGGTISADTTGGWLRLDTNDKVNLGLIETTAGGNLALDEIRLDNYGTVDIQDYTTLLVDASILDCHETGTLTVGPDANVELRRGGAIVGCPAMTTGVGSQVLVGGVGQTTSPDPDVAYNEFALPGMNHAGSLVVFNPAATGQAAPDTGDTILTVGGDFDTSGQVSVGAGSTMIVDGPYTQSAGSTDVEGLMVAEGGRVRIDAGSLNIDDAGGAALDLTDNNLIVDYEADSSPYEEIEGWIASAYNGGAWDGPGITSSDADADDYALGVADTADGDFTAPADLEGEPFDDSAVLVKYTFYADANLDGQVGTKDVNALINGWNGAYAGDPRWTVGDFNYDGSIGTKDVNKLINSWNTHFGEHLPEPASLALLGLGAAAMLARRRRR